MHEALVNSANVMLALAARLYTDDELMTAIKEENKAMREAVQL